MILCHKLRRLRLFCDYAEFMSEMGFDVYQMPWVSLLYLDVWEKMYWRS